MCLGLVDSCTGMSWMYGIDAASTAEVIRVLDHWRVQKCGGNRCEELVMDNGTCFTSKAMQSYLTSIGTRYKHAGSYHQHQNGPAEAAWNRNTPLCTKQLLQAPHLGTKYWVESMIHANDQLVRAPLRAHNNRIPAQTFG